MCGIFAYLSAAGPLKTAELQTCQVSTESLKPRGPERTITRQIAANIFFGFQRLAIMDPSTKGDQPFTDPEQRASLICNGEIYNSKELTSKFDLPVQSGSDCEVILYLYLKHGLEALLAELDGVFALAIYDHRREELLLARDPFGVRPLFLACTDRTIIAASEVKALLGHTSVKPFPPGSYWSSADRLMRPYYIVLPSADNFLSRKPLLTIKKIIDETFTAAIRKRLQSDRQIGCLLSGGLDSSLVTAKICRLCPEQTITTYSIGFKGSTDLLAARKVAKYLRTDHHEIIITESQAIAAISEVIRVLETWDTTTIRASTPMYLLSQYVATKTPNVKVLFSGEGADELCQGYLYFHNQPTAAAGHTESVRLLRDLYYFDVLRSDRSTAAWGLEVRVPFLDKFFVELYLSIAPEYRSPSPEKGEKWLLRETFDGQALLPKEILWRTKEAFSDGCSTQERSWFSIVQEHAEKNVSDVELSSAAQTFPYCPPKTKESYLFRKHFASFYSGWAKLIPYQWMPQWVDSQILDPSARVLGVYSQRTGTHKKLK